jgi:Dyp-type peroxidase family
MANPSVQIKSRSVLGATELTLLAPLRRGLIPALDSRSYVSRARLVLDTLQALGISRREIDPTPAIAEVADSIRAIRSFRLSIVGELQPPPQPPFPQVLLSVSFDGGWEPYMRRIWNPLGPLLDLIFCNCEGYLLSSRHGFRDYAGWVRRAQVETSFYYEDSPLTVSDQHLLADKAGQPLPAPPASAGSLHEQARAAMVAFYRLSDMHPDRADLDDGDVLRRAAQLLLGELSREIGNPPPQGFLRTPTEEAAWRWFCAPLRPALAEPAPRPLDLANVQAGILESHPDIVQGRLVLVGLDDAAAAGMFLEHLEKNLEVTPAAPPFKARGPLIVNLAFTYAGLVLAGVDNGTLEQLPAEFREGMEARAGILGDWQYNHPRHWALPRRHGQPAERVQLSTVHAVLQLWSTQADASALDAAVGALATALAGQGQVLAVEPMRRIINQSTQAIEGHFGFADGISQPGLPASGRIERDVVAPGELLLGHVNDRKDRPLEGRLWTGSSFLVVRKLRQDVKAFRDLKLNDGQKASLMGRYPDGKNLIDPTTVNNFDYAKDTDGRKCPFHAHVRRANPRSTRENELGQLPRIARRGMSYGPVFDDKSADEDRGLMFMAYNASIAEQFEVVQGWLAGGNSSGPGSFSGLRDPLLGVAREGDPRHFVWSGGHVVLPADRPLVTLQWGLYAFAPSMAALKELQLWARERAAEDCIPEVDKPPEGHDPDALRRKLDRRDRERARQAAIGAALILQLQQLEQMQGFDAALERWKIALEDMSARMSGSSQAIWTAVRQAHAGALRTPYGVLVCSKTLVDQVFANANGTYSVSGYNTRLDKSFGQIYLGRDDGHVYRAEADPANKAIMTVKEDQAFSSAHQHTVDVLTAAMSSLTPGQEIVVDVKDLVDGMLAAFCVEWFGLPDGQYVEAGGWHWRTQATCPGHFQAPSRYTFQPQPGARARQVGEEHGQLLKQQVTYFVGAVRANPNAQGRLGKELFKAFGNDDRLASTLIGVMMGFLPTVDGNLRGVLFEWVRDRSLWDRQAALRSITAGTALARAQQALRQELDRTMQLRPVPEVVWRTALRGDRLGPVEVRAGDTVVISIVSAMQEDLLDGRRCPFPVFGGDRRSSSPPTHACPGYGMAIGVMLGFLAALLDTFELRPASSPMSLRLVKP